MPETHSRNNIRIVKTEVDPEFSEFEYVEPVSIKHRGRSAGFNPANRFDKTHTKPTFEDVVEQEIRVPTQYLADASKSILAKNDSPDIPFTYSINPYRGCEHGCIYCYARPSHEYLGYSSGLDFETRILVKHDAAALLEKEFRNPRWVPEAICLSGNTDCYQPVERKLEITRSLLKVFLRYRNPVRIITKNHLVTRDLDLLSELARLNLVGALISITTLDPELAHRMEPRTSLPKKRLQTIEAMAKAGVPVGVMTAPVIPGLNDHEIPEILRMASEAGATSAGYTVVRLTHSLKELFKDWLAREYPARSEKVIHSIEDTRHGGLNNTEFFKRQTGEGTMSDHISETFALFSRKYGLNKEVVRKKPAAFLRDGVEQMRLF